MKVCLCWSEQHGRKLWWGGVVDTGRGSFHFTAVNNGVRIWSEEDTQLSSMKLCTRRNSSISKHSHAGLQHYLQTTVTKRQLLLHFFTVYKKAKFQRARSSNRTQPCFAVKHSTAPRSQSRMFPTQTFTSPKHTYTFVNKPCLGGDCRVAGTSELVQAGHSYWTCANCATVQALEVLASTCKIADENNAPTAAVKKRFLAQGGKIRLAPPKTDHHVSGNIRDAICDGVP